jgi:DNA-binding FadR family transcriptional regulator
VLRSDVGPVTIGFATARAIDAYDIESVHASRLLVERRVVADAARRIRSDTLDSLETSLEAQKAATNDAVRFLICDREFHVTIYRASGNPLLADFATDLYAYMMDHRRMAVARPGAIATSYRDHLAIAAALRDRDPETAVQAFTVHTERIYETTRSLLGKPSEH